MFDLLVMNPVFVSCLDSWCEPWYDPDICLMWTLCEPWDLNPVIWHLRLDTWPWPTVWDNEPSTRHEGFMSLSLMHRWLDFRARKWCLAPSPDSCFWFIMLWKTLWPAGAYGCILVVSWFACTCISWWLMVCAIHVFHTLGSSWLQPLEVSPHFLGTRSPLRTPWYPDMWSGSICDLVRARRGFLSPYTLTFICHYLFHMCYNLIYDLPCDLIWLDLDLWKILICLSRDLTWHDLTWISGLFTLILDLAFWAWY